MKIYDCFMFSDEKMILDIRLNVLNEYVDHFVIIESKYKHNGDIKGRNFDIEDFSNFRNKIIYIYLDNEPGNLVSLDTDRSENEKNIILLHNTYLRENSQRDMINEGISNANSKDLIIVGDIDEIPNLKNCNFEKIKTEIIVFKQMMFYYKLNLFYKELIWNGTKLCSKKKLHSPQWLRNVKAKNYPFWRADVLFSRKKYINLKFINDGGWHFTNIKTPEEIFSKMNSFLHNVDFKLSGLNLNDIKKMVSEKKILYDHFADQRKINRWDSSVVLNPINISFMPEYVKNNKEKFKNWLE